MWAYNIATQVWGRVAPSFPCPECSTLNDVGYGVGAWMGRHLYRYAQVVDASGSPLSGGGQLWRWAPSAMMPSGGGGGGGLGGAASGSSASSPGNTAGIAMGVALGLANLALLSYLGSQQGLLPVECSKLGAAACCWQGGRGTGAGGFYTSTSSSPAGEAGGYTAPQ